MTISELAESDFFPSKDMPVLIRFWSGFLCKMHNALKRIKNQFSVFLSFIFRIIVKIHRKLGWFEHKNDRNSKKKNQKNRKFDFSLDSAHSSSFM